MVNRPAVMGAKMFETSAIVKCYACRKARHKKLFHSISPRYVDRYKNPKWQQHGQSLKRHLYQNI